MDLRRARGDEMLQPGATHLRERVQRVDPRHDLATVIACANAQGEHGGGFSADGPARIEAADRAGRERLLRHCARPPLPSERPGAFAAALGGLDTLVFAGGIGESAPAVRTRMCDGVGFLGIELDVRRNATNADIISAMASRATVRVIRTDEDRMIAKTVCLVAGLD